MFKKKWTNRNILKHIPENQTHGKCILVISRIPEFEFWLIMYTFSLVIKPLRINYAVLCIMRRIQTIEDFKVQDIAGWEQIFLKMKLSDTHG